MDERESTGRRTREIATLLAVGAVLLVADQLSKAAVAANLAIGERRDVIGTVVQIWHAENSGAAFSLLQNLLPLFLLVTVVALGLVAYFARSFHGRSLWFFGVLGLVLGGTLGNFTDRIVRGGRVLDFVSVGIGDVRWPTFNVADSSLIVGILGLVAILWWIDAGAGSVTPGDERAEGSRPAPGPQAPPGDPTPGGGAG